MGQLIAEKTQEPTPYRRQTARREGHRARSSEVVGAVIIGGIALGMPLFMGAVWQFSRQLLHESFSSSVVKTADLDLVPLFRPVIVTMGPILLAFGCGIFLLAVFANVLQRSVGWRPDRCMPDLSRLNPTLRVIRWLSFDQTLIVCVSVLRLVITLSVMVTWLWTNRDSVAQLSVMGVPELGDHLVSMGTEAILVAACCVGAWAAVDYGLQRWKLEKSLRMTQTEIRDEARRRDGDPKIRMQRRARHSLLASGRQDGFGPVQIDHPVPIEKN